MVDMSRVIRFVRGEPVYSSCYGAYIYFIHFLQDGSIRRDVRVLLVDDTRVKIGFGGGYCTLLLNPT
jgi:hypothetical protein